MEIEHKIKLTEKQRKERMKILLKYCDKIHTLFDKMEDELQGVIYE